MKQFIIAGLCAVLVTAPTQRASAPTLPLVCLVLTAGIVGGCMVVYINTCGPKYYCVEDPDNPGWQWCAPTTRRECQINGWTVNHGPFKKHEDCATICTNQFHLNASIETGITVYLERSTNLVNWTPCAELANVDPECFDWSETNSLNSACFYRAYYTEQILPGALSEVAGE